MLRGHEGQAVEWCYLFECGPQGEQLYGRFNEVDVECVLLCLRCLWRSRGRPDLSVWNSEIWAADKILSHLPRENVVLLMSM